MTEDLRFPIGGFEYQATSDPGVRAARIETIAATPAMLRAAVAGFTDRQLDTPYRPGGWTVRQVVHHLPDSHLNAYTRCKLALTEDRPVIKPYDEERWAELPDSARPIGGSLALLDHLHERWVALLRALSADRFERTCFHPASQIEMSLDRLVATYAWHGAHHVAHITELRRRQGW